MSDGDEGVCVAVCIAVCVAAVCIAVCVAIYIHIYMLSKCATAAFWTACMYIHTYTYLNSVSHFAYIYARSKWQRQQRTTLYMYSQKRSIFLKRDSYSWKETYIYDLRSIYINWWSKRQRQQRMIAGVLSKESYMPEKRFIFLERDLYFRWETYIHISFIHIQAVKKAELAHNSIHIFPKETYILEKRLIFMKRDLYS